MGTDWDDKPGLLESAWRAKRMVAGLALVGATLMVIAVVRRRGVVGAHPLVR